MIRPMLIVALAVLLLAPISLSDSHTVAANAPDHLASMLVISFKDVKEPADALQRLDIDDVMGNQIKRIRPDEKVLSKTINGLPAKLFTGTANIANTKMPF